MKTQHNKNRDVAKAVIRWKKRREKITQLDNSSRDNIQIGALEIKIQKNQREKTVKETLSKQNKTIKNFPELKTVSPNAKANYWPTDCPTKMFTKISIEAYF